MRTDDPSPSARSRDRLARRSAPPHSCSASSRQHRRGSCARCVLYQVRSVLLLAYVSGLFAMGISPLVQMIERQRLIPIGARLPRWLAILIIYAVILGAIVLIGASVIPPLVEQAEELWRTLPERIEQAQAALVRIRDLAAADHARRGGAAGTPGRRRDGRRHGLRRRPQRARRRVRRDHAVLLTFYMLVESTRSSRSSCVCFPRAQRAQVSDDHRDRRDRR